MERGGQESGKVAQKVSVFVGCSLIEAAGGALSRSRPSRSANTGNANNEYNVTAAGSNNNNNANNGNPVAPAFNAVYHRGQMLVPSWEAKASAE